MAERKGDRIVILKVKKANTHTIVHANNPELGSKAFDGANVFGFESSEFTAHLEKLAKEHGITLEEERKAFYSIIP